MSKNVPILMYHSISERATSAFQEYAVPPALFAEHMGALVGAGMLTVTVSDLVKRRHQPEPLDRQQMVVLTFDDGYSDFHEEAFPVLLEARMASTLYVTTGYVGDRSRWLAPEGEADRRMLNWSQLEEIAAQGVEIGAHSVTHPQMDLGRRGAMRREAEACRLELEDRLSVPIRSFAYPYGYASHATRSIVTAVGYESACRVGDLVSTPRDRDVALPRITVTPHMSAEQLVDRLAREATHAERVRSSARAGASWALRRVGLKKRESARYSKSLR